MSRDSSNVSTNRLSIEKIHGALTTSCTILSPSLLQIRRYGDYCRSRRAEQHEDDLVKLMKLKFGIPSRDTIRRILQATTPLSFQKYFLVWIDSFRETNTTEKELVAIDGKTLRRSHDHKNDLGALHIVSAFSCENGISLGQIACEEKSQPFTEHIVLIIPNVLFNKELGVRD